MQTQDYLALRLVRLKAPDEWPMSQEGLSFVFLKGGSGKYVSGQAQQRVAPGDVLVVEGAGGRLCIAKGSELVFWTFVLRLEHLFPLFGGHEISQLQRVVESFKRSKLLPASSALARQCHGLVEEISPQFNLDHRGQVLRIAAAILTEEFKVAHQQRTSSVSVEERMVGVFERLSADQLLSFTVGELAVKFGCSRRHLNRLFHHYFGFSVAALRMEMRLLKAISLLRNSNMKVINVAEQCGFNHLGLFNTCFKRRFTVSPGEWRKEALRRESQSPAAPAETAACPLRPKGLCPLTGEPRNLVRLAPKILPPAKTASAKALPALFPENNGEPQALPAIENPTHVPLPASV